MNDKANSVERVIGLDAHPDSFTAAILRGPTPAAAVVEKVYNKVPMAQLPSWAQKHTTVQDLIVLEASGNSFQVVRTLAAIDRKAKVLESCQMGKLKEAHANNDKLSAVRIGKAYQADFEAPQVTGPSDPNVIENYVRRYDGASKDSNVWKGTVDLFPLEDMTLSVGYKWKDVPYSDTTLGLLSLKGHEWHVDADSLIAKRVKLYGYFDYEYTKADQRQRTYTSGTTANPAPPPTPTNFNWTTTETDRTYAYALGSDLYAIPKKLTFKLQYTFIQSKGSADYTYLLGANPLPPTRNQDNIDDHKQAAASFLAISAFFRASSTLASRAFICAVVAHPKKMRLVSKSPAKTIDQPECL